MKKIFTDVFEPEIEMQTESGVESYLKQVVGLQQEEFFVEFSNVMAAKHNLMATPTGIKGFKEKQAKVTDLTDKALWLCMLVYGEDAIKAFNGSDPTAINTLISNVDEKVASSNLPPKEHGEALVRHLGPHLRKQ